MTIPEAAIEAAAEAIYAARGYEGIPHDDTGETRSVWASSLDYAEAAIPVIREAIAREIEAEAPEHRRGIGFVGSPAQQRRYALLDAARIVRGGTP